MWWYESRLRAWLKGGRQRGNVGGEIQLRDPTDADHEAIANVMSRAYPHEPPNAAETVRWWFGRADADRPKATLVAQSGDRIVGLGYLRGAPPLPGLTLDVDVDPDYRRRGIGTRLLQALDAVAGPHDFATQMAIHERFTGSLAFAARHGFAEHDRSSESALELSAFDPDAYADVTQAAQVQGIRFVTMQEVDSPEMRHRLYPLANQVSLDMPSLEPMTPMTYAQYVGAWLEAPHSRLDLLVIGFDGEEPAAVSMVIVWPNGSAYNWMTGVAPTHRGKGLGLAVKVEALRRAKAAGIAEVRTDNHDRNAPMLAINARLGYRRLPGTIWVMRPPGLMALLLDAAVTG